MRILGIDPGLATVGYGVIDVHGPRDLECISYGCIRTASNLSMGARLRIIYDDMQELIRRYEPDQASVEKLYFKQNVSTGIQVAQARGIILLAIEQNEVPFEEYAPVQVKSRILGYGHAEKHQMQYMVANTLGLEKRPKPDDAADGLALAICHHYSAKNSKNIWLQGKVS